MEVSNKDLKVSAAILIPTLLFLLVWVVACISVLAGDSMKGMDNGIIVFFLILGLFTIKKLFISLIKIRKLHP